jgi:hypothetical protein
VLWIRIRIDFGRLDQDPDLGGESDPTKIGKREENGSQNFRSGSALKPVFRIRDILVWIRIRGPMPLTNGSGCWSGSCYFRH